MDETTASVQVRLVDPRDLLVDCNIRTDMRLSKEFVADVRERGVRTPITVTAADEGQLRVRLGNRRTLAAIEAGRATVPVVVEDDQGDDVGRIVDQFAENENRAGLTAGERVGVVEQLTAFGVSPAQITKKLRVLKRGEVDAALAVSGSALARAATDRYALTLEQAAGLAEFDGDDETVKALVVAAEDSPGRFVHVLQRARDDREDAARGRAAVEAIAVSGVAVLEGRAPWHNEPGPVRLLADLRDGDGQPITPAGHAGCPGHAAHLGVQHGHWTDAQAATVLLDGDESTEGPTEYQARYAADYVCTDFRAYGHMLRWAGQTEDADSVPATNAEAAARKEAARLQRRAVIDNNKAWRSAEVVRREFLTTLLARRTPPKGASTWIARALAHGDHAYTRAASEGHKLACSIFGVQPRAGYYTATPDGLLGLLEGASDTRAQVVTLGLVLAAYEAATGTDSWRTVSHPTVTYLRFLTQSGYTLSDVERLACGDQPAEPDEPGDAA